MSKRAWTPSDLREKINGLQTGPMPKCRQTRGPFPPGLSTRTNKHNRHYQIPATVSIAGVQTNPEREARSHETTLWKIPRRLARFQRETAPRRISHRSRSYRAPDRDASGQPKPQAAAGTIARAAAEYQQAQRKNPNVKAALAQLVAAEGSKRPAEIDAQAIQKACAGWGEFSPHTRATYAKCMRRFFRYVEQAGMALPGSLSGAVPIYRPPMPRLIVATDEERQKLLDGAQPALRFFLLLCGDLGIRHKTAARMSRSNYDRRNRALTFTTKGNVHQTLPVTTDIAATIEALPAGGDPSEPIINLLRAGARPGHQPGRNPRLQKQWTKLKQKLGVRAELHIHDLRRTVAEEVWGATHDIRMVQAQLGHQSPVTTARYLANRINLQDLRPVLAKVEALRIARRKGEQE